MKRRLFSIITALALALSLLPGRALAAEGEPGGGTVVSTAEALQTAVTAASGGTATITLAADVDMGTAALQITGGDVTLDCGGYTLSGSGNQTINIDMTNGSLTVRNGTVKNIGGNYGINMSGLSGTLTVEQGAVIAADGNPYSKGIFSSSGTIVRIYGRVTGTRIGIHAAGELNLYHGAVITGGTYALFMDNSKTVTVQEDAKAYLNGTELTPPVTTTGPGTLVICRDHQPSTSADGLIYCPTCGFREKAVAEVKIGESAPTYVTSLPVAFTEANSGATITILDNVRWNGEPIKISAGSFKLELNGKTITNAATNRAVFSLTGGSLTVNGEGSIISENSNAIYVNDNQSQLTVNGGTIRTNGNRANAIRVDYGAVTVMGGQIISQRDADSAAALEVSSDGSANIHGGTFTGGVRAKGATNTTKLYGGVFTSVTENGVSVYTSTYLSDLPGEGCAFFDDSGNIITGEALRGETLTGTIRVEPCPHPERKYQFTETTHQTVCTVCGETTAPADHVWDASGTFCTVCGYYPEPVQVVVDGGAPVCYAGLGEAWKAAIAGTNAAVTLLADVSNPSKNPAEGPIPAVPTGKTVTLLGGGHTVSGYMILNGDEPTGDDAPTGGGTLNMEACTFTGGGVSVAGGTAALTGCTFTDYESVYVAGGTAELTNCTFTDKADVYVRGGTAELTNCTFTDETGVSVMGGTAELTNCTAITLNPCVVASGGEVIINSGTYTATYVAAALFLSGDGRAVLRGGSFSGPGAAIAIDSEESSLTLPDLLGHTEEVRYAYYGSDGRPIALAGLTALPPTVTVKACAEPHIRHVAGSLTHSRSCAYCGHNSGLAAENCAYVFDGTAGTCSVCGDVVTVEAAEPESLIYDGALKAFTVTVTQGDRTLTAGTDYTVTYAGGTNAGKASLAVIIGQDQGTYTREFTVQPKPLTVTGITVTDRVYDGTNQVEITGVTLDGAVPGDAVSVNTAGLTGTLSGADAGTYTAVTLPALTLTGAAKDNYTLTQPAGAMPANVTISKAPALAPKTGDVAVANGRAYTYTYGVGALRPEVPEGMSLGSAAVTYELGAVSLGGYYTGGAKIEGQTLTLPIQAVDSEDAGEIGTVTVIIHTGNFEDMTATIHVRSVNKIIPEGAPTLSTATLTYGQSLGSITLSGSMRDGDKTVPGAFAWSSPDNRPAVQDGYAAAWVFTPDDNDAYTIVNGVSDIQVLPASIAGAEITLSAAAYRYDGEAHAPGVASVRLGEVTLTEGVDYAADVPAGREAGAYTVTVTGQGNYTGTAAIAFTINPVETEEIDQKDDSGRDLRLEVETGLSSVPAALQSDTRYDTPKKIENELRTKVRDVMTNVGESIAVFDVTLQYKDESGTWHDVDPNDFPKNGVTAILPYPDGAGATGYRFTVQHLISSGDKAGEMEELTYELTANGLKCKFSSLSPVAVGYEAEAKPEPQPTPGFDLDWGYWPVPQVPGPAPAPVEQPEPEPEPAQPCDGGADCPSRGFTDLDIVGTWYHEAVDYVLRNGLMTGYSNGAFGPDDHLSRAQLAQILYNRAGKPAVTGGSGFIDVPDGKWYAPAVAWAAANGIVSGYGSGLFGPDDNITREQLAVMLWRYAGSPAATDKELRFADADRANGYALEALRWAVENGILNGYGDGRLDPKGLATRAQAAQMLMDAIGDQGGI